MISKRRLRTGKEALDEHAYFQNSQISEREINFASAYVMSYVILRTENEYYNEWNALLFRSLRRPTKSTIVANCG